MFVTPAFAQAAPGGAAGLLSSPLFLLVPMFAIMYFLVIRPQQKRAKQHREMVAALRRGDTVVTSGGMIGKVARVADDEILVELAENVRVRVLRNTISEVRGKTEPVAAEPEDKPKPAARKGRAAKPAAAEAEAEPQDKTE